jgi:hypothetical protein
MYNHNLLQSYDCIDCQLQPNISIGQSLDIGSSIFIFSLPRFDINWFCFLAVKHDCVFGDDLDINEIRFV